MTVKIQNKWLASVAALALLVVAIPLVSLTGANAATRYTCGSACNGVAPTAKVAGQNFACADDAKIINGSNTFPKAANNGVTGKDDTNLIVKVYYSYKCQTIWATVTNTLAIGRLTNLVSLDNYATGISYQYNIPYAGSSLTTKMIDDHATGYGIAAGVSVSEQFRGSYAHYSFAY